MKINKQKLDVQLARKCMTLTELAKDFGTTKPRMSTIINCESVSPVSVGRVAKALDVDVTEIID